jgi:hypothetical protein
MEAAMTERKAFLVYFKKEYIFQWAQGYPQQPQPDNRPILVVAYDISEVADRNKAATKIEELDVSSVFIFQHEVKVEQR